MRYNTTWRDRPARRSLRHHPTVRRSAMPRKKSNRVCSYPGCVNVAINRGLCGGHHAQRMAGRDLRPLLTSPQPNLIYRDSVSWCIELRSDNPERRKIARISEEDIEIIKGRSWYIVRSGYPGTSIDGKAVCLHRFLLNPAPGLEIDHINGDRLDCRRENLRVVSHAENMQNIKRKTGVSGHRNIHMRNGKWAVLVWLRGDAYRGGRYNRLEDAISAARALRAKLFTHHVEERCHAKPDTCPRDKNEVE